jgi:hypothetical protein
VIYDRRAQTQNWILIVRHHPDLEVNEYWYTRQSHLKPFREGEDEAADVCAIKSQYKIALTIQYGGWRWLLIYVHEIKGQHKNAALRGGVHNMNFIAEWASARGWERNYNNTRGGLVLTPLSQYYFFSPPEGCMRCLLLFEQAAVSDNGRVSSKVNSSVENIFWCGRCSLVSICVCSEWAEPKSKRERRWIRGGRRRLKYIILLSRTTSPRARLWIMNKSKPRASERVAFYSFFVSRP